MTYATYEDAMEAFCTELPEETFHYLDNAGVLYDAFTGWCAARGYDWLVPE